MKNLKFITLMRALDPDEVAAFEKYLTQRHGGEKVALAVFRYLRRYHPGLADERKLDLDYACKKIFGPEKLSDRQSRTKLLNSLYDLHGWLKTFLLSEKVRTPSFEGDVLWLTILQEKELESQFALLLARMRKQVAAGARKGIVDYLKSMALHHFLYYHRAQNYLSPDLPVFEQCSRDLDRYYIAARLKLGCEMANMGNLAFGDFDLQTLDELVVRSHQYLPQEDPLLHVYRDIYQLLTTGREEFYQRVLEVIDKNSENIDPDELPAILSYLHNYASAQIRHGREEFWNLTHQLNKLAVSRQIFARKNELSATQFGNIVNAACKSSDFAWASDFVATHSRYLTDADRDDTAAVSQAIILFENRQFKKVLALLEKKDFKDFFQVIRAKTLAIRAYVELDKDASQTFDLIFNFEKYLRRNPRPKDQSVKSTVHFVQLVKMLLRKKEEKERLIAKIEQTDPLFFQTWLLEKAQRYKADFAARRPGRRAANRKNQPIIRSSMIDGSELPSEQNETK